ncbi:Stp1/IreP family PP2C-type Ser/Thr phosphatase [Spirulina major CS-329]|uniref:Stp1/IreP family PP2C-type Ser/Thr phosphatase n=1 Tax=Spirulina TaxID=1154 RepID=UPI0023303891|nr:MULTISPECIES: Stp1/IreP family PP2C-type Ser/Thr phosphatase [Spirulina]MDB9494843.1 Stp1/IreP family PP2C-type Ser/Thr phosphatase [Spirulina subsalsa CS-330]MDB9501708.1 Stp1/IreP family PP2C-type Ser/Thr phosphatase [Spirulina major CS-329]
MARRFTGLTDTGIVRSVNQDDFYIDPEGRFFVVADGMGGHAGGQEASRIATETIKTYLDENWNATLTTPDLLEKAIWEANQDILDDQDTHPERADMGTTVVVLVFREDRPWCAHIGDSRCYRLRQDTLEQITEDQTWVARAMKMGDLSPEDARNHPWRHVLSQCLGRRDLNQLDIQQVEILPGDRCLLCSDGLTEEVHDREIFTHLSSNDDCEAAAAALINAAKTNGGSDNITVVILAET